MVVSQEQKDHVLRCIREVPDFPKPGILFRDIMPCTGNPQAFQTIVDVLAHYVKQSGATCIVGPEARGFIFGCPVAYKLGMPFVPARKAGKLPGKCVKKEYALEYGTATLEIQDGALTKDDKVFVMDDLLATGGTVGAVCDMIISNCGAQLAGIGFVIVLEGLQGAAKLPKNVPVFSLFNF